MRARIDREGPTGDSSGYTNKTLVIVLAVAGGVGLLAVLACAGCGFWVFKSLSTDIPTAKAGADDFLDKLKDGRIDEACAQTREQFGDFVDRFSILKTHTSRTFNGGRVFHGTGGKQTTIKLTLHTANNAMSCTLTLVPEGDEWKVRHLKVP